MNQHVLIEFDGSDDLLPVINGWVRRGAVQSVKITGGIWYAFTKEEGSHRLPSWVVDARTVKLWWHDGECS
jgi:hypothetical protein